MSGQAFGLAPKTWLKLPSPISEYLGSVPGSDPDSGASQILGGSRFKLLSSLLPKWETQFVSWLLVLAPPQF